VKTYGLSAAAAGRRIGKSPSAVIRLVHSGELDAIRVGRTYRVSEGDLADFIERSKVRPGGGRPSGRLLEAIENHRHAVAERRLDAAGIK
jgi:excisionase family DNA binding protein